MQGSILYIDKSQGFIQGDDRNRYYFTESDWQGDISPVMGQIVTFRPDTPNAREVSPVTATWQQSQTFHAPPPPDPVSSFSSSSPSVDSQPETGESTAKKQVYNVLASVAALALFGSLMMPYGQYAYSTFRLVDNGLGAFYYVLPILLLPVLLLGAPRLWALVLTGLSVAASITAFLSQDSLFSQLSKARQQVEQMSGVTDSLFGSQLSNQMQNTVPSFNDVLTGGFYLHILALLILCFLLVLRSYEERTGGVTIETISSASEAGTRITAQTGRIMVANAERLTGQTVPSADQTGNFLRNFLSFDRMIAPTIITITYYIYLVLIVVAGIGFLISGLFLTRYGGSVITLAGLVLLLLGPLWLRLFAEFLIVVFKIHDRLAHIDEKTGVQPRSPEQA